MGEDHNMNKEVDDVIVRRAMFIHDTLRLQAIYNKSSFIPTTWEEATENYKQKVIELVEKLINLGDIEFMEKYIRIAYENFRSELLSSGWKYGKDLDVDKKETPFVVPYDELDEREKVKIKLLFDLIKLAREYIW